MRILGIDPGYDRLGIAVIETGSPRERLVYSSCIESPRTAMFADRLTIIGTAVRTAITEHLPDELAIERLFFGANRTSGIAVAEARGVVIYEAACAGLPVHEYTPAEVKVALTSHGHSDKRHVTEMVRRLLSIERAIKHDDEYDAIAIALTHAACAR